MGSIWKQFSSLGPIWALYGSPFSSQGPIWVRYGNSLVVWVLYGLWVQFSCLNHIWAPYVGRGGALVEAIAFNRRVVGSTPASRHIGTLGKSFTYSCLCASA